MDCLTEKKKKQKFFAVLDASGGLKHPRFTILKNLVSSQIRIHRPFGGVVPNLAKREHLTVGEWVRRFRRGGLRSLE